MKLVRRTVAPALLALVAGVAAGCLPAGTRGNGSHATASGLTVAASSNAATPAPPTGPTPIPSFVPPTPTPAPTFLVYTVRRGDSLNTIAHRFGTTARSIAFWNRDAYPSLDPESARYKPGFVQVGWTLALVPNVTVDEQELPDPSSGDEPAVASDEPSGP